jgi:hypothetical protein
VACGIDEQDQADLVGLETVGREVRGKVGGGAILDEGVGVVPRGVVARDAVEAGERAVERVLRASGRGA